MSATIRRSLNRAVILTGALVASSTLTVPTADAMSVGVRQQVLQVAASKKGTPYRYGATGPRAFDCSGYTRWVFAKAGRRLPRTNGEQRRATRHIKRSDRRRGDLVFFASGGRVYHVGIYAGDGRIWHSPRTGQRVRREPLWSRSVSYGRLR